MSSDLSVSLTHTLLLSLSLSLSLAHFLQYLQMRLEAASGNTLAPGGGTVTQNVHVTNTKYGTKGIMMKIKVTFSLNGEAVVDQAKVANFPQGL